MSSLQCDIELVLLGEYHKSLSNYNFSLIQRNILWKTSLSPQFAVSENAQMGNWNSSKWKSFGEKSFCHNIIAIQCFLVTHPAIFPPLFSIWACISLSLWHAQNFGRKSPAGVKRLAKRRKQWYSTWVEFCWENWREFERLKFKGRQFNLT